MVVAGARKVDRYSDGIVNVIQDLARYLHEEKVGGFIRDYENFPERGAFDIDILIDVQAEERVLHRLREVAEAHGILLLLKAARSGPRRVVVVVLIDLLPSLPEPDWAFVEMHHGTVSPHFKGPVWFQDLAFVWENDLPIPAPEWRDIMAFRKALKKRDFAVGEGMVRQLIGNSVYDRVFKYPPEEAIVAERARTVAENIAGTPGVATRLARRLYIFTPFSKGKVPLFTVQGPDGVGKTATVTEIERLFRTLPIRCQTFHHIDIWREPRRKSKKLQDSAGGSRSPQERVSPARRIARIIYVRLPENVRQRWINLTSYMFYTVSINRVIHAAWPDNCVFVVDRYVDDRHVKLFMRQRKHCSPWIKKAVCWIIERPHISFLLVDSPANIVRRKPELTEDEIARFYRLVRGSIRSRGGCMQEVVVTGRTPHDVANEILRHILRSLGSDFLPLIKSWRFGNAVPSSRARP